jgi:hypothetical protein
MNFLRKRPWLWIVFAFVILIASWTVLLKIATDRRPANVELATPVTR